jgi:hypothetical protein
LSGLLVLWFLLFSRSLVLAIVEGDSNAAAAESTQLKRRIHFIQERRAIFFTENDYLDPFRTTAHRSTIVPSIDITLSSNRYRYRHRHRHPDNRLGAVAGAGAAACCGHNRPVELHLGNIHPAERVAAVLHDHAAANLLLDD